MISIERVKNVESETANESFVRRFLFYLSSFEARNINFDFQGDPVFCLKTF